jgi:hypothetical protein
MPHTCQFKKDDGSLCKRSVGASEAFCWQHSSDLRHKWRSLTRNQSIIFAVSVLALVVGLPSAYWSYIGSRKSVPVAEWFQARDADEETFTLRQQPLSGSVEVLINGLEEPADIVSVHEKDVTVSTKLNNTDVVTIKYRDMR